MGSSQGPSLDLHMYTRVYWGLEHIHSSLCIDDAAMVHIW